MGALEKIKRRRFGQFWPLNVHNYWRIGGIRDWTIPVCCQICFTLQETFTVIFTGNWKSYELLNETFSGRPKIFFGCHAFIYGPKNLKKNPVIAKNEGDRLSKEILKKVENWERNLGKIVLKNLEKLVGSLGTFKQGSLGTFKQGSLGTLGSMGSFEPEFDNFLKIIWNHVAKFCQHFDYVLKKTMKIYKEVNLTTEKFLKFCTSFCSILTTFWHHFEDILTKCLRTQTEFYFYFYWKQRWQLPAPTFLQISFEVMCALFLATLVIFFS